MGTSENPRRPLIAFGEREKNMLPALCNWNQFICGQELAKFFAEKRDRK